FSSVLMPRVKQDSCKATGGSGCERACLRQAGLARAGELQRMRADAEVQTLGELPNGIFNRRCIDWHHGAAGAAHQVMMVAFVAHRKAVAAIHMNAAQHAPLLELVQRAVHRSPAYAAWP